MNTFVKFLLTAFAVALVLSPLAAAEQGQTTVPRNDNVVILTLDLNRGSTVDFSWSANNSVTFRIQNIAGTITFLERTGQTGNGNWEVTADGSYVFELDNPSDFFSVTVQWTVNLRQPLSATLVYFLAALAILGAAIVALMTLRKKAPK